MMKIKMIKAKIFIRFASISKVRSCECNNLSTGTLKYENTIVYVLVKQYSTFVDSLVWFMNKKYNSKY